MSRINNYEEIIHDQVVAERARQLGLFYKVLTDPDISGIYKKDPYPDIIVIDNKNNVLYVEEVVTDNFVTEHERNKLWLGYAQLGYPFNLIVPKAKIVKAEKLIRGLNINKLYSYELSNIEIKFRQLINNMNIM